MHEREADERYTRMLANVAQARDVLLHIGEDHWGRWMEDVHAELVSHHARGLTRLLGAYGGMGSFNDFVVDPVNGHQVGDFDRVNRSPAVLRTAMYIDATALVHDFERAP